MVTTEQPWHPYQHRRPVAGRHGVTYRPARRDHDPITYPAAAAGRSLPRQGRGGEGCSPGDSPADHETRHVLLAVLEGEGEGSPGKQAAVGSLPLRDCVDLTLKKHKAMFMMGKS